MNEPIKRRAGRPKRGEANPDMRQSFIDAAIDILKTEGAAQVTVRNVCEKAGASVGTYYHYFKNKDDLLSFFVKETAYGGLELETPFTDLAGRMVELWRYLTDLYQSLGVEFTRSYYNCDNAAISAYLTVKGSVFQTDTILERCRQELEKAKLEGFFVTEADPLIVSADLCDIVKGCIFEWCLCKGDLPVDDILQRIISNYMRALCINQKPIAN